MLIHKGTIRLESERLILRPFKLEDADAMFHNWASDPEVTKYLTWPAHTDPSVSRMVLESWVHSYSDPDFYQWAIIHKELGELIGSISVVHIDDRTDRLEVGYCIGRRWWHRGYTSEALKLVIDYLFDEVGANRIEACHETDNPNSGGVMRKCGMTCEGTLRSFGRSNQGIVDIRMYSILRTDRV